MFSRKYTLNFDGSHNNQAKTASAGCIIRDDKGELIVAASYNLTKTNLPCYNVAIAEALGLRNGLQLARQHDLNLKLIKGDNKEVIDLVLGQARRLPGPPLAGIIAQIKAMIGQGFTQVTLINGEDNKVADKLASMGSLLLTEFKVFTRFNSHDLPPQVSELIRQDQMNCSTNERTDGSNSLASNIGTAVATVAGVGMLAWGFAKLLSGESSSNSNDQSLKSKAIEAPKPWEFLPNTITNNAPRHSSTCGFYTLQYFGSDRNQLQKARAGCIIKNGGEFCVAAAYNLNNQYPDCNVAIAEAIALRNGLKLAKDNNIRLNNIQGRNVEVRDRVLDQEKRSPKSRDLILFIHQIKIDLSEQGITNLEDVLELVEEDNIGVARALAKVGGTLPQDAKIYETVDKLPPTVRWP